MYGPLLSGLAALRRDNPWVEAPPAPIAPFHLSLDGGDGGRSLIEETIRDRQVSLMVEVGCFLGGSARRWLAASDDLTVIGVDPWEGNWAPYIRRLAAVPKMRAHIAHFSREEIDAICDSLVEAGNFQIALNNLRDLKERFVPVRRRAPEAFAYLAQYQIKPELIYIDADKTRDALDEAYRLFPEAMLCGDDWLWPDENGVLRMQQNVIAFADEHGFTVRHVKQSWLLEPRQAAPAERAVINPLLHSPAMLMIRRLRMSEDSTVSNDALDQLEGMVVAQGLFLAEITASMLNSYNIPAPRFAQRIKEIGAQVTELPEFQPGGGGTPEQREIVAAHVETLGALILDRLERKRAGEKARRAERR
ncbi:hypothetical protein [Sphingomonas sp. ID0503]|uniref:hypothetical protein n=1 Tax=Sphingomonas sp. ID0503 TaxID=3399691 RepID=UPI003AFA5B24